MNKTDILFFQVNKKPVKLTNQCIIENGIEPDEIFTIHKIIGDFEQVEINNQYNQKFTINPNQLTS